MSLRPSKPAGVTQVVSGRPPPWTGSTWYRARGRWSRSWARTGPAKTTFVRAVATLFAPDGGELLVAGHEPAASQPQ